MLNRFALWLIRRRLPKLADHELSSLAMNIGMKLDRCVYFVKKTELARREHMNTIAEQVADDILKHSRWLYETARKARDN